MGGGRWFLGGRVGERKFEKTGEIAGIKLIEPKEKLKPGDRRRDTNLPIFSNTPNTMYWGRGEHGQITQLRVFENNMVKYDFEWGHAHGADFKDELHIHKHEWKVEIIDGEVKATRFPKLPLTDDEWESLKDKIMKVNDKVHHR